MEDLILELLGEKDLKSAWKHKPFKMILFLILMLVNFALVFLIYYGLLYLYRLIFLSGYNEILFMGTEKSDMHAGVMMFGFFIISYVEACIFTLFLSKRRTDVSFVEKEREKEKEDKITPKKIIIAILVLLIGLLGVQYYIGTKNRTIFTENNIYYSTFFHPIAREYDYSDIESVILDNEDGSNLKLDLKMNDGKTVKFRSTGLMHSDIEKYDENENVFIADFVTKLREDDVTIEYNCTYEEIAVYCGEEHHDTLKIIFNK